MTEEDSRGISILISTIVKDIVTTPGEVVCIVETDPGSNHSDIIIKVAQHDVGRVIGRQGQTIKAIRTISGAAASMKGSTVRVNVEE